ncbi:hypothetical protein PLIIFM63780_003584 [Purpureocillium lilacinum]|nr:hypothetical protein PLIIFM63780_003584 [Purpureocillium lilacinum]
MSFFDLLKAQYKTLPQPLTPEDCHGRTFIVTGANAGLGLEATKHLVSLGSARVIMAVRNTRSGEAAKEDIEEATGRRGMLEVWRLDLASYDSVVEFAAKAQTDLDRIDGLIENAGVAMGQWTEAEGNETSVTVNVISTMLLAVLLLPHMEKTAAKHATVPRIAMIGSIVAFDAQPSLAKMDRDNILGDLRDRQKWEPHMDARSKMLSLFAFRQLSELAPVSRTGVVMNWINPGICITGLDRNANFAIKLQIGFARALMGRTAEQGSRTLLHGLAADEESHGKYLTECEVRDDLVPEWFTNEDGRDWQVRIWSEVAKVLDRVQPGCVRRIEA